MRDVKTKRESLRSTCQLPPVRDSLYSSPHPPFSHFLSPNLPSASTSTISFKSLASCDTHVLVKGTKVALLHIQSLDNKSFLINDLSTIYNLDFMLLTETWIDNCSSAPFLIDSAPPNLNCMNVSLPDRKDGVAAIFKDSFQCE